MATIKIRGRLEPVTVDNDVAKKVKARKFGTGVPQAEPNELVDLGDWSGEYGRIVEIEIPKASDAKDANAEQLRKDNEKTAKWKAQSPAVKAQVVGWFKVLYSSRLGDWRINPPKDILDKVIELHEKLYTENPKLMPMLIPASAYGELLPRKGEASVKISEKMRVVRDPDLEDPLAF